MIKCKSCGRKSYESAVRCDCGKSLREAAGEDEATLRVREERSAQLMAAKGATLSGIALVAAGGFRLWLRSSTDESVSLLGVILLALGIVSTIAGLSGLFASRK